MSIPESRVPDSWLSFIIFFIPSPPLQLPVAISLHFPSLPGDPSGSLGDEPLDDGGILEKQGVEPTDQNGCLPPTYSIVVKREE